MAISKKLYQMENKTLSLLLNKAGSTGLPQKIRQVESELDAYAQRLANDMTKTPAAQTLMLCEKIEKSIMSVLRDLDKERAAAFSEAERAEQKLQGEIKFKDTTDLLLCARYGDSITDKNEFLSLVGSDFDAARIALKDPLTRKKFKVDKDSLIEKTARKTAALKIFGEEGVEKNKQMKSRIDAMDTYGAHFSSIISTIDSIRQPIAANVVS